MIENVGQKMSVTWE